MTVLPNYFVRKVSGYPAGMKMPKMVRWKQEFTPYVPFKYSGGNVNGDPLSGGDLRYWCGIAGSIAVNRGYASCRCCAEVCTTKESRKEHKRIKCGQKLEEAYKMLRRSTECIICKLETHRKVYGLPMCCKDCEYEWEYVTSCPSVLRYLLEEID